MVHWLLLFRSSIHSTTTSNSARLLTFALLSSHIIWFAKFREGIYFGLFCKETVNHSVVIVGYGSMFGIPYWICRNSWGQHWGSGGYFLIMRGVNMCNIEKYPAKVTAKVRRPKEFWSIECVKLVGLWVLIFYCVISLFINSQFTHYKRNLNVKTSKCSSYLRPLSLTTLMSNQFYNWFYFTDFTLWYTYRFMMKH